jgi:hypothetical protein
MNIGIVWGNSLISGWQPTQKNLTVIPLIAADRARPRQKAAENPLRSIWSLDNQQLP